MRLASALALTMAALGTALPAAAQEGLPDGPVVVAVGRATAERAAEYAEVSAAVVGEGDSQVEALTELEAARSRIQDGVASLEGGRALSVTASDISLERVFGPDCEANDYDTRRSIGVCEPEGYVASLRLTFRISPAERAGPALSLAGELGAQNVDIGDVGVLEPEALRDEAARLAFEDARRQAELVAAAAGARLGPIVRILNGAARYDSIAGLVDPQEIVVTGSRIRRPVVMLSVTPPPVEESATLSVVFELER